MPPRHSFRLLGQVTSANASQIRPGPLLPQRAVAAHYRLRRAFSTDFPTPESNTGPLIRVTNLPAPNTGHIRVLELNRPSARNAISRALLHSLRDEIEAVQAQYGPDGEELPVPRRFGGAAGVDEKGPTRAVVLASAIDSCFCAGADLKERMGFSQEETSAFLLTLRTTLTTLTSLPVPTIAAISSVALGGGLELALAAHFRVLSSTAIVGLPETRLGIIPGAGGTYRLASLIGTGRARDLVLTGRRVGAAEAYFLGIADRLVEVLPEEETGEAGKKEGGETMKGDLASRARRLALAEAVRLAQEICEGGPIAVRAALAAVRADGGQELENRMYDKVVRTGDRDEALVAFREKRRPMFKGR